MSSSRQHALGLCDWVSTLGANTREWSSTVSFYGPTALSWLPAHWVRADRRGRGRFGAPPNLAVTGQPPQEGGEIAHRAALPPNEQSIGPVAVDETDAEVRPLASWRDRQWAVLVAAWDKVRRGQEERNRVTRPCLTNVYSGGPRGLLE